MYAVYALHQSDAIDFDIDKSTTNTNTGQVVPSEQFAARVTVLGSAITYGGQYDVPVTVRVHAGGTTINPFGDASTPVAANVNDGSNPRSYILPTVYSRGTQVVVEAESWVKTDNSLDGTQISHWESHLSTDSNQSTYNAITLRDGDPVPRATGVIILEQPISVI